MGSDLTFAAPGMDDRNGPKAPIRGSRFSVRFGLNLSLSVPAVLLSVTDLVGRPLA